MKTTFKTSKTLKEYHIEAYGYNIKVPINSIISNKTAVGNDDNYRFLANCDQIAEVLTGQKNSLLAHDLKYYGLNIPSQFCEPYQD